MRGRRIFVPKGRDVRPTSDRVREALFSLIGQDLRGIVVLDLYAGTGALGIEALSRGADRAVFVDHAPRALEIIRRNLEQCGLTDLADVVRHDLRRGLPSRRPAPERTFGLAFLDPPYGKDLADPLLAQLGRAGILAPHALVVVETGAGESLRNHGDTLRLLERRTYGDTRIHLFRIESGDGSEIGEPPQPERAP
ncbi:MAG: 16S rRNA (guanine(966)-N(2))-methyltransferase RsmD [Deltaproteobacteria bacterium]|nr:16S rRNA (guanine(966)-N(2))-methyltransferase RsmD [Deltaproteobacteria bacterium]